jgi:MtN3 and saliva related transmembrane protein
VWRALAEYGDPGITGVFQIVWIYYGLLIASRPVIAWNTIGALLNLLTVGAYVRFSRSEANRGPG